MRLAARVRIAPSGCHEYVGFRQRQGYGMLTLGAGGPTQRWLAHRLAWALAHGDAIDDAVCVLHRCDNPPCVNVEHLFLGTRADNVRDMVEKGRADCTAAPRHQRAKTHCPAGHPYDEANTIVRRGARECRACRDLRIDRLAAAQKAERHARRPELATMNRRGGQKRGVVSRSYARTREDRLRTEVADRLDPFADEGGAS